MVPVELSPHLYHGVKLAFGIIIMRSYLMALKICGPSSASTLEIHTSPSLFSQLFNTQERYDVSEQRYWSHRDQREAFRNTRPDSDVLQSECDDRLRVSSMCTVSRLAGRLPLQLHLRLVIFQTAEMDTRQCLIFCAPRGPFHPRRLSI